MTGHKVRPSVKDRSDGEADIEDVTSSQRTRIRELLVELYHEVEELELHDTKISISADIRICVRDDTVRQHTYHVDVGAAESRPPMSAPSSSQSPAPLRPPPTFASIDIASHDEDRRNDNNKRARTESFDDRQGDRDSRSVDRSGTKAVSKSSSRLDSPGVIKFLQEWRQQWLQQGGWMYDFFSRTTEDERRKKTWLQQQFETHAGGVIATVNVHQSQNAQSLENLAGTCQWLESSRKKDFEASQAREEKWRHSSATFHDQTRKEREGAEKTILDQLTEQKVALDEQHRMLIQLMESQGLDLPQAD